MLGPVKQRPRAAASPAPRADRVTDVSAFPGVLERSKIVLEEGVSSIPAKIISLERRADRKGFCMYGRKNKLPNRYGYLFSSEALGSSLRPMLPITSILVTLFYFTGEAGAIRQFRGGVRIPAGACNLDGVNQSTFVGWPSGGLFLFNSLGVD